MGNKIEQPPTSVSAIIIRSDGKVFIAQRSWKKKLSPGQWETIGGKLELKETPEDGLRCEIKEELGVNIKSFKFFNNYSYSPGKVSTTYIVEIEKGPQPNVQDFASWGWFDEKGIMSLDFTLDCKKRLLDYFKSLLRQEGIRLD